MRRFITFFLCALLMFPAFASLVAAQTRSFTNQNVDYTLELPNATWRSVSRPDSMHQHTEFVYGDRADGYLRVRKEMVDASVTMAALAQRNQESKLRFLPGYVEGKQESFAGRWPAIVTSYEFTQAGKPTTASTICKPTTARSTPYTSPARATNSTASATRPTPSRAASKRSNSIFRLAIR